MDFQFPTTWQELEQIVDAGILDELSVDCKRSLKLTRIYEFERSTVSKEEAIKNIYSEINTSVTRLSTGEEIALTYNKYPYDLLLQNLPGVTHALLWFKGSVSVETAKAYLRSIGKTCCLYENPVAFKSIPEINHYQVFLLNSLSSFPLAAAA
ncbi:hypothetical protein K9N68_35480 (plasmid) [Kovacikia minuta CCNUW1]|uniref:hypothetical protein n=1 Tax=Kovacikia minuta TaxID=2931930 RepID=UPI001CCA9B30|nr:hypothetical protein [Kovacikia minuta]UBF30490.1 hypothetical protein K9N68_35480 [Kovacikia minuta CCNUW1]